jgi:outer membrane biosynthesis protein TonB
MNSSAKAAALILLTAFVAGCRHKTNATPPAAAQAPITPVSQSAKNTPPPEMPPPTLPKIEPPGSDNTASSEKPKPKKPAHHKPKPTTQTIPADGPAASAPAKDQATAEQAANGAAGDISPIGELSAAGDGTNAPMRSQILDEINSTEKGLNDLKRPLSADEQTTSAQIRAFLVKAKEAMNQEDLVGAHTLVTKAKVLLDELTKQ